MKSIGNWRSEIWNFIFNFIPFQIKFLTYWKEPAKSFATARVEAYQIFDRSKTKFRDKMGFWKSLFKSNYFKVYFNQENKLIGYKLIARKGIFKIVSQAQRIFSFDEINSEIDQKDINITNLLSGSFLDISHLFFNNINVKENLILWKIRKTYDAKDPNGKSYYFYKNPEFFVEFLAKFQIRGIFVEGINIQLEKTLQIPQYIKKYKNSDGIYKGYDEIHSGKVRNSLRLFFNEDGVLILTDRFALLNNKKELREISRYDCLGNKANSELYEGKVLQKSAVFFYNEDRKLVKIIQYGPDGNILS